MSDVESLRRDIVAMVDELRVTIQDIGDQDLTEDSVVSNARDRLRYISTLTEQSAGQTLTAVEALSSRLRTQKKQAEELAKLTRSPLIRDFLTQLVAQHQLSQGDITEIIQAQAFQDLVGQVVNKLMVMVQHMEDNLVHLLIDVEQGSALMAGPAVTPDERVTQDDIDDLFG